ncbi:hypothetical protein AMTRI_Chr05g62590 [Amborella trichopoda]|uniref:Transmembrane protein 128 n=1 Tax=Amborella trichopoda TaxID=13333 RepID=W1PA12_AMBTC|nr:transmembrane protein 128 [Amborella trichopoda]ERN04539.1 hypothetical protein AMTR_s00081p00159750 [Amborella trichopoda]|eukprot:XP_020521962.1 transmembrane protein 128 [Amborella trichopoda]
MVSGTLRFVVRQRHNQGDSGYASSSDDLEENSPLSLNDPEPKLDRSRPWIHFMENFLWLASAAFILYYGDRRSNFIYLVCHDERIKRTALNLGLACLVLIVGIMSYMAVLMREKGRADERLDLLPPFALPTMAVLGLLSFLLFSVALWPIWSFLTLPLLLTLYVALTVVSPYTPFANLRSHAEMMRAD